MRGSPGKRLKDRTRVESFTASFPIADISDTGKVCCTLHSENSTLRTVRGLSDQVNLELL